MGGPPAQRAVRREVCVEPNPARSGAERDADQTTRAGRAAGVAFRQPRDDVAFSMEHSGPSDTGQHAVRRPGQHIDRGAQYSQGRDPGNGNNGGPQRVRTSQRRGRIFQFRSGLPRLES